MTSAGRASPPPARPVYAFSGLTRVYQRRTVLDIPRLQIEAGQIYALLGPNGAGKTTLLNILAFLSAPTAGTIHFRGQRVRFSEKELRALRREVVMVEQHPILFTTTVFKNMEFGLKVRHVPPAQRTARIEESLELVGMAHFMRAPAHRLSGGETQRVALARALVLKPRVLLCDEPTSSVDVENQAIIANILRQINAEQQITILFATHDRTQAAELAHRTLLLDHGRLVKGRYENVYTAALEQSAGGPWACTIHPRITLTMTADSAGFTGDDLPRNPRVFIDPAGIRPVSDAEQPGCVNRVQGLVRQTARLNDRIRLELDAGVPLVVTLSETRYRQQPVLVGDTLWLHIPPEAIELLKSGPA